MANRLLVVSGNCFDSDPWRDHTARIWAEFAERFDEVHIFARSVDQTFKSASQGNIYLHLIPRGPRPMATFLLSSWLAPLFAVRWGATHILAQSPVHGGPAAVVTGRLLKNPVYLEFHGEQYFRSRPKGALAHWLFYRPLSLLTTAGATRLRALSPEMRDEIARVYPRSVTKTVVVPNRVNLQTFRPVKRTYESSGPLRVITVGALVQRKNHLALLRALSDSSCPVTLTIVGSGPLSRELQAEADRVGIELEILGNQTHEQLACRLRASDVYIHFATSEGVPRAILEAMAIGLPVIATSVGFMRGIVNHGRNGLLLDASGDGLDPALHSVQDAAFRRRLGEAASRTIEEEHEWHAVFAQYVDSVLYMRNAKTT
ncbi:glycosyltransferase family 4 protein [Phycicoccus sp. Soil748]|uniref:glycosyltransferase family 4 protein n=1 Tax=Phycicoccus sp. Soil748 TaxID=1736397 RepID=UPI0009EC4749